jgi:serine protease Do
MRITLLVMGIALGISAVGQSPRNVGMASNASSFIGVMVQEIDSERSKALKLPEEAGVEITRVEPGSPAEKAGLSAGDAIMQYNNQRVEGMEQFSRLVRETPAGRDVRLAIVRNGAPQTVTVRVAARRVQMTMIGLAPPPPGPVAEPFELRMPDMPRSVMSWRSAALGIECEALENQLAQFFGVKEGVLVRSVLKASAAEKGGIRAGDVITRVDDARVVTPADISSRIRSRRGDQITIVLMRDHKEMTLSLTVDQDHAVAPHVYTEDAAAFDFACVIRCAWINTSTSVRVTPSAVAI